MCPSLIDLVNLSMIRCLAEEYREGLRLALEVRARIFEPGTIPNLADLELAGHSWLRTGCISESGTRLSMDSPTKWSQHDETVMAERLKKTVAKYLRLALFITRHAGVVAHECVKSFDLF